VRECLGWIPLVTPTSQIVGVQAMLNVKFGRWKNFSPEAMKIALGYYGKTPGPINPEVLALAEKARRQAEVYRPAGRHARTAHAQAPGRARAKRPSRRRRALRHLRDVSAGAGETLQGARRQGGGPCGGSSDGGRFPPEVKAPAPAALTIPGTSKKISQLALTIDGRRHEVSVEELA